MPKKSLLSGISTTISAVSNTIPVCTQESNSTAPLTIIDNQNRLATNSNSPFCETSALPLNEVNSLVVSPDNTANINITPADQSSDKSQPLVSVGVRGNSGVVESNGLLHKFRSVIPNDFWTQHLKSNENFVLDTQVEQLSMSKANNVNSQGIKMEVDSVPIERHESVLCQNDVEHSAQLSETKKNNLEIDVLKANDLKTVCDTPKTVSEFTRAIKDLGRKNNLATCLHQEREPIKQGVDDSVKHVAQVSHTESESTATTSNGILDTESSACGRKTDDKPERVSDADTDKNSVRDVKLQSLLVSISEFEIEKEELSQCNPQDFPSQLSAQPETTHQSTEDSILLPGELQLNISSRRLAHILPLSIEDFEETIHKINTRTITASDFVSFTTKCILFFYSHFDNFSNLVTAMDSFESDKVEHMEQYLYNTFFMPIPEYDNRIAALQNPDTLHTEFDQCELYTIIENKVAQYFVQYSRRKRIEHENATNSRDLMCDFCFQKTRLLETTGNPFEFLDSESLGLDLGIVISDILLSVAQEIQEIVETDLCTM